MDIKTLTDEDFAGIISVKREGKVILQTAYGYADLANQVWNRVNTKFATGALGKVFVATAILRLVEDGKISLDDTIGHLLRYNFRNINTDITVEQLLTHTSGIPDYVDENKVEDCSELWKAFPNYRIRKSVDVLPLFFGKDMLFEPGEKFYYSNSGYVLLGIIIEKITKQPFDKYIEDIIFKPCGMHTTGYYELDRLPKRCAFSYIYDKESKEYYTNIYNVNAKGTGAGGAYMTANDMDYFWYHLFSGCIISKEMVEKMITPHVKNDDEIYGYGVWLDEYEDGVYFPYSEGSDAGISAISIYNTLEKHSITIFSNFGQDVWSMCRKIRAIIE